jgi:RNA polymerase sigma factor (TIGR02999 family)
MQAGDDTPSPSVDLAALVRRANESDREAVDSLFACCYAELHRLAERHLRRAGGALTLGATTLLHEAYINMAGHDGLAFVDRSRFFAYASRAMRRLVIDYARRRQALKRGRHLEITLAGDDQLTPHALQSSEALVHLGDALDELTMLEPRLAELVDLHFFCGFSFTELAALRGVSDRTVQRDWQTARMLLHQALLDDPDAEH